MTDSTEIIQRAAATLREHAEEDLRLATWLESWKGVTPPKFGDPQVEAWNRAYAAARDYIVEHPRSRAAELRERYGSPLPEEATDDD